LPHCPTYALSKNENESPRGRLALIQGWSESKITLSAALNQHIDSCLTCRACESMCPAKVPYSRLLNDFRAETHRTQDNSLEEKAISALTGEHRSAINKALRLAQKTGLTKLPIRGTEYLPAYIASNKLSAKNPSLATKKVGSVALFTGCASETLDAKTLHDTIYLLQHCGFDVSIPQNQACCGAIDLHAGNKEKHEQLAEKNTAAFKDYDAIISVASGCGSTLADYNNSLARHVVDISEFLSRHLSTLSFNPLDASAWLHMPCTLKNTSYGLKGASIAPLLSKISGLDIHTFDANQHCCGAAGTYMLTHKDTSNSLREQVLTPVKKHETNYLLTSNIGCAMHLRAGLKQTGIRTDVLHPVSLLAQQLKV